MKSKFIIIVPSLNNGGAEIVGINIANFLTSQDFSVDLICLKGFKNISIDKISPSVKIHFFEAKRTLWSVVKLHRFLKNNSDACLMSVIRDVNIVTAIAAFGITFRAIYFREANTFDGFKYMTKRRKIFYKFLMMLSYIKADKVIANSFDTKADLISSHICKSSKVKVIGNPVLPYNFLHLGRVNVDLDWFDNKSVKVILSVGRLSPQKNFTYLIDAFSKAYLNNNNIRLLIIGDGPLKSELSDQILQKGLRGLVRIVPGKANVFPYFYRSDIFALTSLWEGFGNVIVEAIAFGLPVIASKVPGGVSNILRGGVGDLVSLDDQSIFVKKMLRLIENSDIQDDKMVARKKRAMDYTVEKIVPDYLSEIWLD